MSRDSRDAAYGLVMFLVGSAVGAAVALLYAPREGAETRRVLGETAANVKDKATEATANARTVAKDKLSVVSDKAQELFNRGASLLDSDSTDRAIDRVKAGIDNAAAAATDLAQRGKHAAESALDDAAVVAKRGADQPA
jgi:gas vesicle protein